MRWLALAPALAWLALAIAVDPGAPWEATYYPTKALSGEPVRTYQREVMQYWDKWHRQVAGAISYRQFSARYRTCLTVQRDSKVVLVVAARGRASLSVDGEQRLAVDGRRRRATRGIELSVQAGAHLVDVDFVPHAWPVIGVSASLAGEAPQALGAPDASRPSRGPVPCPAR